MSILSSEFPPPPTPNLEYCQRAQCSSVHGSCGREARNVQRGGVREVSGQDCALLPDMCGGAGMGSSCWKRVLASCEHRQRLACVRIAGMLAGSWGVDTDVHQNQHCRISSRFIMSLPLGDTPTCLLTHGDRANGTALASDSPYR